MDVDEFYRQPAAVPFKWEIKPGVPRNHHRLRQSPTHSPQHHQKLKPPPAVSNFLHPSNSLHSSSRTRSDRWRFARSNLLEPEQVSSGCFPSPLPNRKSPKTVSRKPEPDYSSELETLSRWSVSSRKSISPFRYSVSSSPSSFSSNQSSPRPTSDTDWAGFGLFWPWALRDVGPKYRSPVVAHLASDSDWAWFWAFWFSRFESECGLLELLWLMSRNRKALNPYCIVLFAIMGIFL